MSRLRRIFIFVTVTLIILFVSVFLFTTKVYAQSTLNTSNANPQIEFSMPVVEVPDLLSSSLVIDDKQKEIAKVESDVSMQEQRLLDEQQHINELKNAKATHTKSIEQLNKEIEQLKSKIAEKKAREAREAEAARLAALAKQRTVYTRTYTVNYTAGNTYSYGYCTWYVKNVRSDIPNGWGNAAEWYYNAQRSGFATGSTPRAGAVGVSFGGYYGHVVYVRSVNSNGTVNISEMNYAGWNVVSSRTVNASAFKYIY